MTTQAILPYDQVMFDDYAAFKPYMLGPRTSHALRADPRHLLFSLSRYKFCAKMLEGKERVLEVGCGDAFAAPIMLQTVGHLHCVDIEPRMIEQSIAANEFPDRLSFAVADITRQRPQGEFDAAISLDVLEHIPPDMEKKFLTNLVDCLTQHCVCIIGTPNIAADKYASALSRHGHVNLKSQNTLKDSLAPYFRHIFLFSMNDEVVHTGFAPMAHFLFAMCVEKY